MNKKKKGTFYPKNQGTDIPTQQKTKQQVAVSSSPNSQKTFPKGMFWLTSVLIPLAFAAFAFYVLVALNSEVLYCYQERSLFVTDSSFFDMHTTLPGGLLGWLGCYFIQYFNTPWIGALIMVLMWLAIYFISTKAFRIGSPFHPLALIIPTILLCSVVGLGYWIYYSKVPGYAFAETIGTLMMVSAVWAGAAVKNRWFCIGWMVVWSVLGYIAFGWYALLATLCIALLNLKSWMHWAVAAACIIVIPLVAYNCCTKMVLSHSWIAAFPLFQNDIITNTRIIWMFAGLAVTALALSVAPVSSKWTDFTKKSRNGLLVCALVLVSCIGMAYGTFQANIDDFNFHSEMRMYRAIDEARWQDVLDEAAVAPVHPTREQVMLRNIALMNLGKFGSSMFHYDNKSIPPVVYDSLHVHMVQTNGPLTYMNYARTNFATRWCIENGVEYGFCNDGYKVLIRSALISGEYDLAQKYINILKHTKNYRAWAERYEAVNGDSVKIAELPEMKNICELHNNFKSILDGDEGLLEMYLLNYFSNTQNKNSKFLNELTLAFALISKDIQLFWPKFFLYATLHEDEMMPIHYQEAAYLYGNLEQGVDISNMPFDQSLIIDRYRRFQEVSQSYLRQGMQVEEVGDAMQSTFGDTFWWFYFFARNQRSY